MADIVNLNRARKARRRADEAAVAEANRVRFGRTRAAREQDAAEARRREALLDGARREE